MKNFPDLGVLFVMWLVFFFTFYLVSLIFNRLGWAVEDAMLVYALISAIAFLYGKDKN